MANFDIEKQIGGHWTSMWRFKHLSLQVLGGHYVLSGCLKIEESGIDGTATK